MSKSYVSDYNLQVAMTEYNEAMEVPNRVETENGTYVGRASQVYDNEHGSGEQVSVVLLLSRLVYVIL